MAAERGNLAVEFYDPAIADGVGHRLEGAFNRLNVAAAMAVGRYFGVDEERIRDAVAHTGPTTTARSGDRRPAIRSSSIVTTPIRRVCRRRWPISSARSRSAARSPCWAICSNWGRGVRRSIVRRSEQALAGDVEQLWLVGTEFSAAWRAMGCGDERVRLFATCDEAAAALQASPFAGQVRAAERVARDRTGTIDRVVVIGQCFG